MILADRGAKSAPTASPVEDVTPEDSMLLQPRHELLHHRAARVIQRTWRKHVDTHAFKYFKSIVSFHNQGDPRQLLKYVNPREADILDAAAGVYIRFRLGGTSFPPNIYYKIFTHRPIVDMCANSPKDYTHVSLKRPVPRQVHNHRPLAHDDHSSWYCRVENNGWRLLSGKIALYGDPITKDTNDKMAEFHHSKIHRRQDVERKKKIRKIEWLKKMYDEGALRARTEHRDTVLLVEKSVQGMMSAVEQLGPNHIVDWEVDELLEWTYTLNFDEYMTEWNHLGTSSSSAESCKDKRLVRSKHDPCEFSQLSQEDSQVVTYSSVLHRLVSSLIKSENSRANISDWNM